MKLRNNIFIIILGLIAVNVYGQQLKITPNKAPAVDRSTRNGISTIIFSSTIDDLMVTTTFEDDVVVVPGGGKSYYHILYVDPQEDLRNEMEISERTVTLSCSKSADYTFTTPELIPNQVLYYSVVLPDTFVPAVMAEYIVTKTADHGLRLSFGKRFGGYIGYKWGRYKPSGNNIADITEDYDLTQAKELGYIRTSITGGVRIGLLQSDWLSLNSSLYLLLGGGYGEYGRQWSNLYLVDDSAYFYSDYLKGFNGEIALQSSIFDWLCLSLGADMMVSKGVLSVDYQIGVGITLNLNKFYRTKKMAL